MKNSIEVIKSLEYALKNESIDSDIQIIGGVCTAALSDPETVINIDDKEVIAPSSLFLSTVRPDGSKRDLDILVKSSESADIEFINHIAQTTIATDLDPSVFGYKTEDVLENQIRHPLFGRAALKTFLSDRYVVSPGLEHKLIPISCVLRLVEKKERYGMVKSLFPFVVPIDPESMESWTLTVGDMHLPIPNPAMSIINYTNRSISGVRPKDLEKLHIMRDNVLSKAPELRDWALDGPGWDQVKLGLLLRPLTPNKSHVDIFNSGKSIAPNSSLSERPEFMFGNLTESQKRQILAVTAFKAEFLSYFESKPGIVSLFQKNLEHRVGSIVNND